MERKHYRIIALDMDGTLLTSDKTIAPDTVRDIRAASERGIHVVYCTGRAVPELTTETGDDFRACANELFKASGRPPPPARPQRHPQQRF